jgi:hypothetical protein
MGNSSAMQAPNMYQANIIIVKDYQEYHITYHNKTYIHMKYLI